ncbi:MAG: 2Fe-2S iron-sulfur cluster-binding protein, partial [Phycisphaerales bacterium]
MAQITINGTAYEFSKGEKILQVALRHDVEIPHYCYHPSMSIPASCRICL